MTTALEGGEGLASRPGHSLPRERQEAGWVPGPVWTGAKNLAPPGFDPRIVQLVASRHTDYVNRPTVQVQFYSFFNLGARWGWMVNATSQPLYPRERPGTSYTGGCVGPSSGLHGSGKSRLYWIRSPDRPARSQSLYRLSYPAYRVNFTFTNTITPKRHTRTDLHLNPVLTRKRKRKPGTFKEVLFELWRRFRRKNSLASYFQYLNC